MAPQVDTEHKALEGCFKIMYDCLKHKRPHHTNYEPLLQLCRRLGCTFFDGLKVSWQCLNNLNCCFTTICYKLLRVIIIINLLEGWLQHHLHQQPHHRWDAGADRQDAWPPVGDRGVKVPSLGHNGWRDNRHLCHQTVGSCREASKMFKYDLNDSCCSWKLRVTVLLYFSPAT